MELDPKDEKAIIQQHLNFGYPLPPFIKNAPVLHDSLQLYLKAFRHLSTCRHQGMGPGPIPWTAIVEYAKVLELSEDQTEALHHHVTALDSAYLEWCDKRINREPKK